MDQDPLTLRPPDDSTPDLFLGIPDGLEKPRNRSRSAFDLGISLGDSTTTTQLVYLPNIGLLGESTEQYKLGAQPNPLSVEPEDPNQSVVRNVVEFISSELNEWRDSHQKHLVELLETQKLTNSRITKFENEIKRLDQRSLLLNKRIENIKDENQTLRETITHLENVLNNGPDAVSALTHIKDKLWEGSLQISPEKKRHIHLLKKLTLTRFNASNEKHAALLQKFLQLHNNYSSELSTAEQYIQLGFPESSNNDLDTTGILGLQNLVYFSERYNALATKMNSCGKYHFPSVGISISALLITVLDLCSNDSNIPANDITKTFVRLMDHPKAFEELYCVCLRLYDKGMEAGDPEPLKQTASQIRNLLSSSPKDLQQLIASAETL